KKAKKPASPKDESTGPTKKKSIENNGSKTSLSSAVQSLNGAVKRPMPSSVRPMLANITEDPFDDPNWIFEIKWDGYRAVSFIENGAVRLVSRNQNDLTPRYPELRELPKFIKAQNAILDGELVVLDEQGRSSFSLMQQRTGIRVHGRQTAPQRDLPV